MRDAAGPELNCLAVGSVTTAWLGFSEELVSFIGAQFLTHRTSILQSVSKLQFFKQRSTKGRINIEIVKM